MGSHSCQRLGRRFYPLSTQLLLKATLLKESLPGNISFSDMPSLRTKSHTLAAMRGWSSRWGMTNSILGIVEQLKTKPTASLTMLLCRLRWQPQAHRDVVRMLCQLIANPWGACLRNFLARTSAAFIWTSDNMYHVCAAIRFS